MSRRFPNFGRTAGALGPKRTLALADIRRPAGEVTLLSGRIVPVRRMDRDALDLYEAILADPQRAKEIWDLAARLLPDATPAEIRALDPEMIAAVAQIAVGRRGAVESWLREESR